MAGGLALSGLVPWQVDCLAVALMKRSKSIRRLNRFKFHFKRGTHGVSPDQFRLRLATGG